MPIQCVKRSIYTGNPIAAFNSPDEGRRCFSFQLFSDDSNCRFRQRICVRFLCWMHTHPGGCNHASPSTCTGTPSVPRTKVTKRKRINYVPIHSHATMRPAAKKTMLAEFFFCCFKIDLIFDLIRPF